MTHTRQNLFAIGVGATVLAALALAAANFLGDAGENGGLGAYLATLGDFHRDRRGRVRLGNPAQRAPGTSRDRSPAHSRSCRCRSTGRGVPYVLGPAAIALGLIGNTRPQGRGAAMVAVVLGALATAAAVAVVFIDGAS